jgi:hypothetical protein
MPIHTGQSGFARAICWAGVTFMLSLGSCVSVDKRQQYVVEVTRGADIEERVRIAQTMVTREGFARLAQELRKRVPALTDEDVQGMALAWKRNVFVSTNGSSQTSVTVTVSVRERKGLDAADVASVAGRILNAELNSVSGRSGQ